MYQQVVRLPCACSDHTKTHQCDIISAGTLLLYALGTTITQLLVYSLFTREKKTIYRGYLV